MKPSALAPDEAAAKKLAQKLRSLSLRPQEGASSGPNVFGTKFVFPANDRKLEAVTLDRAGNDDAVTLVVQLDGVEQRIACAPGVWHKTRIAWGQLPEQPMAASGGWTADDTFTAKLCFYETPYVFTLRLKFQGREVQYDGEANVSFGPTKDPQLTGRAE
jgi:hypothetical protein